MKIKNKIIIYFSTVLILFSVVLVVAVNNISQKFFVDQVKRSQSDYSDYILNLLDNRIQYYLHLISNIDLSLEFYDYHDKDLLEDRLAKLATDSPITVRTFAGGMYLINVKDGSIVSALNSKLDDPDFFLQNINLGRVEKEELLAIPQIFSLEKEKTTDSLVLPFFKTIKNNDGETTGLFAGLLPLFRLDTRFKRLFDDSFGESGYFMVINTEMKLMVHPDINRISENYILEDIQKLYYLVRDREKTTIILLDEYDVEQIMFLDFFSYLDWVLISCYPMEEIYILNRRLSSRIFVFSLFAMVTLILTVFLLSKKILKKLGDLSGLIGKTNLDVPLDDYGLKTNDEIDIVIKSFNQMVTKLRGQYDYISGRESLFSVILENIKQGVAVCEIDYCKGSPVDVSFKSVNIKFCQIFEQKRDDILKKKASESIEFLFKDRINWMEKFAHVAKNKNELHYDSYFSAYDSRWYYLHAFGVEESTFVWIVDDVTESKKAKKTLQKLNECFINFTPEPTQNINLLVSTLGETLGAESALYNRLSGGILQTKGKWRVPENYIEFDRPDGHICFDVISLDEAKIFYEGNLPDSKYYETDSNIRKSNYVSYVGIPVKMNGQNIGSLSALFSNVKTITEEHKRILEIIASAISVEEEREMVKAAVESAKNDAVSANNAKSRFLADMSHEFRTPMNGIMGMTDLVLTTELDTEQRDYLEVVKFSAEKLMKLINRLLDLNRIERGVLILESEEFSLRKIISYSIKNVSTKIFNKELDLFVDINDSIPDLLEGDAFRLHQIISNLLDNAVRFTKEGYIVLEIIRLSKTTENVKLQISVRDTGLGIPVNKQSLIFSNDLTGDEIVSRRYSGSGLGLNITRELVNLMNGSIWVESEENHGSTFHLVIQFKISRDDKPFNSKPYFDVLKNKKVLILSKNPIMNKLLGRYCYDIGMKPEFCEEFSRSSVNTANMDFEQYDIIILVEKDFGETFGVIAEAVSSAKKTKNIKLVLIGTFKHSTSLYHRFGKSIDGVIYKPVMSKQIYSALMNLFIEGHKADPRDIHMQLPKNSLKVLVVEDDAVNQILTREILLKSGYLVDVVDDGKKALDFVKKHKVDLILMDIQMPVMDGIEAVKQIRQFERNKGISTTIIALTAHAYQEDIDLYFSSGFDGFIAKPIDKESFLSVLQKIHDGKRIDRSK